MRAFCFADLHARANFLPALKNLLKREKFDCIFCLGDIVNAGREVKYLGRLLTIVNNLHLSFFSVPGNNDIGEVYIAMEKYSVENKMVELKGEKIVGMGGVPDLYGHNIYYPKVAAKDFANSIFLSHIPPVRVEGLKRRDYQIEKRKIFKDAPKIQISGHVHSAWGVGYIGKTKILKLPAGLDMMAAILDTKSLAVEFIDMKKYDKGSLNN